MEFTEKVKQIESTEKDVDMVLKAARLTRNPEDTRKTQMILEYLTVMLFMFLFAVVSITLVWILATHR